MGKSTNTAGKVTQSNYFLSKIKEIFVVKNKKTQTKLKVHFGLSKG